MKNYRIPFNFSPLFNSKPLASVDIINSINQHIRLIILTSYGEHRVDPEYGSSLSDLDFNIMDNRSAFEDRLNKSVTAGILKYEHRISNVAVNIRIQEEILATERNDKEIKIKNKVLIFVNAIQNHNREPYEYTTEVYIGPLSITNPFM